MLLAQRSHKRASRRVEAHVTHAERRSVNCRRGTRHGTNTRKQFLGGKRLGQVIVGTGIQALDLIGHLAFCREHDDGQSLSGGACTLEHLDAVHAGHHDVQDCGVVIVGE